MTLSPPLLFLACLAGAIVAVLLLERLFSLINNWMLDCWAERMVARLRDRIAHPEKYARKPAPRLLPESLVVVRLTDAEVICERPDGLTERVAWDALQSVTILTTADGPFAPDVFWLLIGQPGGCAVPQGATGHEELLQRLQALPGFDNEAVIRAMGSTEEASFLCWQKPPAADGQPIPP